MTIRLGSRYALLAALAWAVSILLTRVLLNAGEDSYNLVFWTTVLTVPYWITILWKNKSSGIDLGKKDLLLVIAMGILSPAGTKITEALALQSSSSINYSFLIRTVTPFTLFFAWLLLGEKIGFKKLAMVGVILVGAYLLSTNGESLVLATGDLFTLSNAVLLAFSNNVLGKMATNRMSPALASSAAFLAGVVPIILLSGVQGSIGIPRNPLLIVMLAMVATLITIWRFQAYAHESASHVSIIFSLTPVFVTILAIPLLGESLSVVEIIGGLMIITAGLMIERWKTTKDVVQPNT